MDFGTTTASRALNFLEPAVDPGSFAFFVTLCLFLVLLVAGVVWECRKKRQHGTSYLYMASASVLVGAITFLAIYSVRELRVERSPTSDYRGAVEISQVSALEERQSGQNKHVTLFSADIQVRLPSCTRCRSASLFDGRGMESMGKKLLCEQSCDEDESASADDCAEIARSKVVTCMNKLLSNPIHVDGDCGTCTAKIQNYKVSQSRYLWLGSILALVSIISAVLGTLMRIVFCTASLTHQETDADLTSVGLARTESMSSCGANSEKGGL